MHFCGEDVETGLAVPPEPGTVGYCGAVEPVPLIVEGGVWVCQADSSWMEQ